MYPKIELLGCMVNLFLIFWGTAILFSTATIHLYISASSVQRFPFILIVADICYCFWWLPFWQVWGDILLWFWFAFSWGLWCWASFHVPICRLYILFGKMSNQIFCLFLIGLFGFWYWVVWAIYIVWILSPPWSHHSSSKLSFHFVDGFLCSPKAFKFNWVTWTF